MQISWSWQYNTKLNVFKPCHACCFSPPLMVIKYYTYGQNKICSSYLNWLDKCLTQFLIEKYFLRLNMFLFSQKNIETFKRITKSLNNFTARYCQLNCSYTYLECIFSVHVYHISFSYFLHMLICIIIAVLIPHKITRVQIKRP